MIKVVSSDTENTTEFWMYFTIIYARISNLFIFTTSVLSEAPYN